MKEKPENEICACNYGARKDDHSLRECHSVEVAFWDENVDDYDGSIASAAAADKVES